MKKFKFLSILLLAIAFILTNCTKEGPAGANGTNGTNGATGATGTTGAQGPTGTTGTQGPAGVTNVIYSSWLDLNMTNGDGGTDYDGEYFVVDSSLTQSIIDSGVVLAYWNDGGGNVYPFPFQFPGSINGGAYLRDFYSVGSIFVYSDSSLIFNGFANFRYVIVPGSVLGGRGVNTIDQLKSMSYKAICSLFKIPD